MNQSHAGLTVLGLPAPTQGVAALEDLALLEHMEDASLRARVTAVALALEDARRVVRDGAAVERLLDPVMLKNRARQVPMLSMEPPGERYT